jgi:hypothetical protein
LNRELRDQTRNDCLMDRAVGEGVARYALYAMGRRVEFPVEKKDMLLHD